MHKDRFPPRAFFHGLIVLSPVTLMALGDGGLLTYVHACFDPQLVFLKLEPISAVALRL